MGGIGTVSTKRVVTFCLLQASPSRKDSSPRPLHARRPASFRNRRSETGLAIRRPRSPTDQATFIFTSLNSVFRVDLPARLRASRTSGVLAMPATAAPPFSRSSTSVPGRSSKVSSADSRRCRRRRDCHHRGYRRFRGIRKRKARGFNAHLGGVSGSSISFQRWAQRNSL